MSEDDGVLVSNDNVVGIDNMIYLTGVKIPMYDSIEGIEALVGWLSRDPKFKCQE